MDYLVTRGLTACTPVTALGPMLPNKHGKPLPFYNCSGRSALGLVECMK